MGTEKTPLIQKLILGVLTLILICLIVLIAQNRSKPQTDLASTGKPVEPTPMAVEVQTEQPLVARTASTPRSLPVAAVPQPASPVTTESDVSAPAPTTQQPPVRPPPYTTLVNPVARTPVDIVVRPDGQVLKTELCGRVRLEGNPPREIPITLDAPCQQLHDAPLTTRHYVVGPDGGLANVLVYIKEGLPSGFNSPPTNKPMLTLHGCLYEPYVVGVQTGQRFIIQNLDGILHNFHATAKHNRQFNLAIPVRGKITERSFDNPEVFIRFKCDVHPWEFSYMGVVPHRFFSVTDTNGIFCLPPGLPHGRYMLAAAHPKAGETLQQIVIGDADPNPIELAFTVQH